MDFFPMHRYLVWAFETELDAISLNLHNGHRDVVSDHHAFSFLATQNEHL
jgi:hypothetical protein